MVIDGGAIKKKNDDVSFEEDFRINLLESHVARKSTFGKNIWPNVVKAKNQNNSSH